MKEKKTEEGEYELGAYIGCATLLWILFFVINSLGLVYLVFKIINLEQFIYIFVVLITFFLVLAISFTYDAFKLRKKLRKKIEVKVFT